jgi:hypothetical protein
VFVALRRLNLDRLSQHGRRTRRDGEIPPLRIGLGLAPNDLANWSDGIHDCPDILAWRLATGTDLGFVAGLFKVRQTFEPAVAAIAALRRTAGPLRVESEPF